MLDACTANRKGTMSGALGGNFWLENLRQRTGGTLQLPLACGMPQLESCTSISVHSETLERQQNSARLLVSADFLQHYVYNSASLAASRYCLVFSRCGLPGSEQPAACFQGATCKGGGQVSAIRPPSCQGTKGESSHVKPKLSRFPDARRGTWVMRNVDVDIAGRQR